VVGKYIDLQTHIRAFTNHSRHAAASQDCGIDLKLIDAEIAEQGVVAIKGRSRRVDPGGFGVSRVGRKDNAARFARGTSSVSRSLSRHAGRDD